MCQTPTNFIKSTSARHSYTMMRKESKDKRTQREETKLVICNKGKESVVWQITFKLISPVDYSLSILLYYKMKTINCLQPYNFNKEECNIKTSLYKFIVKVLLCIRMLRLNRLWTQQPIINLLLYYILQAEHHTQFAFHLFSVGTALCQIAESLKERRPRQISNMSSTL